MRLSRLKHCFSDATGYQQIALSQDGKDGRAPLQTGSRHILMACSCLFTTIRGNEEARVLVVFLYHRLWEVSSVALAVSILFSVYEVPFCISSFKVQVGFCAQLSIQTNFGFSDSCVVSCILIKVVLQGNDG